MQLLGQLGESAPKLNCSEKPVRLNCALVENETLTEQLASALPEQQRAQAHRKDCVVSWNEKGSGVAEPLNDESGND